MSSSFVISKDGSQLELFSLWENRKVVLAFTRHMGCRFCREQVHALQKTFANLQDASVMAIVITMGRYQDISRFQSETGFMGEIYVDASLEAPEWYQVMRLGRGKSLLFADTDSSTSTSGDDSIEEEGVLREETMQAALRVGDSFVDGGYPNPLDDSPYTGDLFQVQ